MKFTHGELVGAQVKHRCFVDVALHFVVHILEMEVIAQGV